jgi:hypothetical protein
MRAVGQSTTEMAARKTRTFNQYMTAHRYDYDPEAPGIAPPELGPLRPTLRKGDEGETVAELQNLLAVPGLSRMASSAPARSSSSRVSRR